MVALHMLPETKLQQLEKVLPDPYREMWLSMVREDQGALCNENWYMSKYEQVHQKETRERER